MKRMVPSRTSMFFICLHRLSFPFFLRAETRPDQSLSVCSYLFDIVVVIFSSLMRVLVHM